MRTDAAKLLVAQATSREAAPVGATDRVADDNADMRDYLAGCSAIAMTCEAVADGRQRWKPRAGRPDLVLADVMMPRLDGFGLLRAIRDDPALAARRSYWCPRERARSHASKGSQAGADDYLVKPFTARELLARVETHIKLANFRRETTGSAKSGCATRRNSNTRNSAQARNDWPRPTVCTGISPNAKEESGGWSMPTSSASSSGTLEGRILDASNAFLRMVGYDREELSGRLRWTDMTPPEWLERDERHLDARTQNDRQLQPYEKEYFRKDGSRVPVLLGVATSKTAGTRVSRSCST